MDDELFIVYYLLYKLKNNKILWVSQISDDYYELKRRIRNFSSDIEKYYIVSKEVHYSELKLQVKQFKQFKQFDYNIHCETILQ